MDKLMTTDGVKIFYKYWGTGQAVGFPSWLAADRGRLECPDDVFPGARLSCDRARSPWPRLLDSDGRRARHGHLRRRRCSTRQGPGSPERCALRSLHVRRRGNALLKHRDVNLSSAPTAPCQRPTARETR